MLCGAEALLGLNLRVRQPSSNRHVLYEAVLILLTVCSLWKKEGSLRVIRDNRRHMLRTSIELTSALSQSKSDPISHSLALIPWSRT